MTDRSDIVAHGNLILQALAAVPDVAHHGWASQVLRERDLTALCPAAWLQPGAAQPRAQAGRGRSVTLSRTWVVVLTVAGWSEEHALEEQGGALVAAVRQALVGLPLDPRGHRRLEYAQEPEPYYAPGYMEIPLEFEAHETLRGKSNV